jgi:hypothetical protein
LTSRGEVGLGNEGARAVRQFWKLVAFVDTGFNGGISFCQCVRSGAAGSGAWLRAVSDLNSRMGRSVDDFVFHGWAQIADMPEVPTEVIVTLSGDPLIGMELLESWDATVSFNLPQRKVIVSTP